MSTSGTGTATTVPSVRSSISHAGSRDQEKSVASARATLSPVPNAINRSGCVIRSPSPNAGFAALSDLALAANDKATARLVTKGHDADLEARARDESVPWSMRPRSLRLREQKISPGGCATADPHFVGAISSLKTLRKGGFV